MISVLDLGVIVGHRGSSRLLQVPLSSCSAIDEELSTFFVRSFVFVVWSLCRSSFVLVTVVANVAVWLRIREDRRKGGSCCCCFAFALVFVFLDDRVCFWTVIGWTPSMLLFVFRSNVSFGAPYSHKRVTVCRFVIPT